MARTTNISTTGFIHNADYKGHVIIREASGRAVSIPMQDLLEFVGRSQQHESDVAMQNALRQEELAKPVLVCALHESPLTGLDQKPECEGHHDEDYTLTSGVGIGEPTFCDGSCQPRQNHETD
jgi:hypothetical protein